MAIEDQKITDNYSIYNGDCMEVMPKMPDGKVHLVVYSPPFSGLYQYSSSPRDLSNCADYEDFFEQYDFIIRELYRITMKGRINCVHCMDIPSGNSGCDHLWDFPGDIIERHVKCRKDDCKESEFKRRKGLCGHGFFDYIGRYVIWKNPWNVRLRTMAKNLAHKTIVEDSSKCSAAGADYMLVFRKRGNNPVPIEHPNGLFEYAGEMKVPHELLKYKGWKGSQIENKYSHWIWRRYASSFWDDIRIDEVLPYKESKDEEDEKHVHPLQLDAIERCLQLWSNEGEVLFTPFMGVGSEVFSAITNNRKGIGVELKPSYYNQAVKNLDEYIYSKKRKNIHDIQAQKEDKEISIPKKKKVKIGFGLR